MIQFATSIRQLYRNYKGIAAVEMALALPILMALLLGGVEMTRYILIAQKVEKVATTIADVATQSESLSTTQLDGIVTAAGAVMKPYSFGSDGYVILSSVSNNSNDIPTVNWQYKSSGDSGDWVNSSQVGITGGVATLPADFTLDDDENVIISEIFYNFTPMFGTNIITGNVSIYKTGFFRPRLGNLTTLSTLDQKKLLPQHKELSLCYAV